VLTVIENVVDLGHLKNLCHLKVTTTYGRDASWLLRLIESISLPSRIEEIHVNIDAPYVVSRSWAQLDTLLSSSHFPQLSIFNIEVLYLLCLDPVTIYHMEENTPRLWAKGVLSLYTHLDRHVQHRKLD